MVTVHLCKCLVDDGSCVCKELGKEYVCEYGVNLRRGGQEGYNYVFCCDSLYSGLFYFFNLNLTPACLFADINLNDFDIALVFFLHVIFILMSLSIVS